MVSKILQTKQGLAVLIPPDMQTQLNLTPDTEINVTVNSALNQIIITPTSATLLGIDETFVQQVSEFIEQYRPALEALAR